jgi:glycosyltransferase involved in cell wall biosynthesis
VKALCTHHNTPSKSYPVEAVLFNNGSNERFDLDFDIPVFASHPLSKGDVFGDLTDAQREAYIRIFKEKIEREVSLFNPDIIHVHHGWIIASILAGSDFPYVITLHGTEYYAFEKFAEYRELVLKGLHGAKSVIALTAKERDQAIRAYGVDPSKAVIVTSGTDTDTFKPIKVDKEGLLKRYSISERDKPVVFFGGRLTDQKGIGTLLKAAKIYSRSDERPITIVAGDGALKQQLEELARELKLEGVYFIGNQNHQQMVELFNIADVVALPSIFEPLGLIAIEALACGTPVIASNVGGFTKTVNTQVGCLVEPGDYITLAEKVTTFIKDGVKAQVGDRAAAYVRENYSWDKTVNSIETIYEQIVN